MIYSIKLDCTHCGETEEMLSGFKYNKCGKCGQESSFTEVKEIKIEKREEFEDTVETDT